MRLKLTCKACCRNIEIEGTNFSNTSIPCPNCGKPLQIPSNILDVDQDLGGFRIEKHLGSGSMGCVYLATQVSMERKVALKVLPPEMTQDSEELDHFFHEVRLLARLDHPHIVAAFEAGEDCGNYFMAMTYVAGETLEDYVGREGPLDEQETLQIGIKIADALKYAWEKHQILHRDIKPDNIMVDKNMVPRLLDMGISKVHSEKASDSQQGFLVGTPHYMSPEQAKSGDDIDFRSDMYGLGCTLYYLASGKVPYEGDSVMDVLTKHALDPFPSPKRLRPELSDAFVEFLRRVMGKKPEDRYNSWDALIADAKRVHNGKLPKAGGGAHQSPAQHIHKSKAELHAEAVFQQMETDQAQSGPIWKRYAKVSIAVTIVAIASALMLTGYFVHQDQIDKNERRAEEASAQRDRERDERMAQERAAVRQQLEERRRAAEEAELLAKEEERLQLQALQLRLEALADRELVAPKAFDELIKGYEKLILDALGTEYEQPARVQTQRLAGLRDEAVREVMEGLDSKAGRNLKSGDLAAARAVYESYDGAFTTETMPARLNRIAALEKEQEDRQLMSARNQGHLERLSDFVAQHLLRLDFEQSDRVFNLALQENPGLGDSAEYQHLRKLVNQAAEFEEIILSSFQEQVGQQVLVALNSETERLEIRSVDGKSVSAQKLVMIGQSQGRVQHNFSVRELSAAEMYKRLGDDACKVRELLRGILATRGGRPDRGQQHFQNVHPILADALIFFATATGPTLQTLANENFNALLKQLGITKGTPKGMIQEVMRLDIKKSQALQMQAQLDRFTRRYGESVTYREHHVFLAMFAKRLAFANKPAPTDASVRKLIEELQTSNSGINLNYTHHIVDNTLELDLSNNASLRELSPLASHPIIRLNLAGTAAGDLSSIYNLPLTALDLSSTPITSTEQLKPFHLSQLRLADTQVKELSGLAEMPLTTLDLSNTPIVELNALAGLPLTHLHLSGCQNIKSFDPLLQIKSLKQLSVPENHTGLDTLQNQKELEQIGYTPNQLQPAEAFWTRYRDAMFAEMETEWRDRLADAVRRLELTNPQVMANNNRLRYETRFTRDGIFIDLSNNRELRSIHALAGLPISELIAYNTAVRLLDPLANAPLKRLSVRNTLVADINVLAKCPIEHIDLRNTRVRNFEIIQSWPVTSVHLSGQEISRPTFLFNKALTALSLEDTGVRDLAFIKDMPLTSLSVSGSSGVSHLDILRHLKDLRRLNIARTNVRSLSYLRHSPIQHLTLDRTEIRDFSSLGQLELITLSSENTRLRNLSHLEGKKITYLNIRQTDVRSLEALAGMPLTSLNAGQTSIRDISPLAKTKLETLWLDNTQVDDLSALTELKLRNLYLHGSDRLKNISPLADMKGLQRLTIPRSAENIDFLRRLPGLRNLSYSYDERWLTVEAFFARRQ